ncbi:MAG: M23 family metallopeptidase [Candidatus Wildermuthbacteria bacterium]|nr:M23 family metallopeptidase [Candidatus Wildermuthbacteria bacterium]
MKGTFMNSSNSGGGSTKANSLRIQRGRKSLVSLFSALLAVFFMALAGTGTAQGFFGISGLLAQGTAAASEFSQQYLGAAKPLVSEAPEFIFVNKTSLMAVTPPVSFTPRVFGIILGEEGSFDSDLKSDVTKYTVVEGDTPSLIANKFGVSLNTILWANSLSKSATLKPGQELVVLPVSGVLHMVRPNDTLSGIAAAYNAKARDVAEFNGLESDSKVFAGDLLIIPNGTMPSRTLARPDLIPVANSYFIYPIPAPHRLTQGLHPFNAVDLSNGACGDPVFAAAGGTVQRTGSTTQGGKYVRILHPNGVVTYYGHLSSITAVPETSVMQGQIIGYVGYTGYTIPKGPAGCHIHFEVRGAINPFAK